MANLFFPLLDMLQKNELLSHLQGRKRSDCFKEMPFAEPLAYVTGHTIRGRAENKPFKKKKTTACPRNAISKRNTTFWNAKQSSESKSCLRTTCKMLPLLQEWRRDALLTAKLTLPTAREQFCLLAANFGATHLQRVRLQSPCSVCSPGHHNALLVMGMRKEMH